jgi:hypothetical protein
MAQDQAADDRRAGAKQAWTVGAIVNVGFLKGLRVVRETAYGFVVESGRGAQYAWRPHHGLERL